MSAKAAFITFTTLWGLAAIVAIVVWPVSHIVSVPALSIGLGAFLAAKFSADRLDG